MFKKKRKEVAPWRQGITAHHNRRPSKADRAEFPTTVIKELIQEADGRCQCCGLLPDTTTHHVMPRGRGGRGVKTNGMRLNGVCHDRIQTNEEELQYWISEWTRRYGPYFWYDAQDFEELEKRKAKEFQMHEQAERLQPVMELLSNATGRKLKPSERRLVHEIGAKPDRLMVFQQLLQDTVGPGITNMDKQFGYGRFDD
ncbi:HNH endonuclease [Paenibacillus chitinolyticus]|uniref:HNH endonuclease n=1 Tax=Paenibacillus chitinolyticus TaxID=79263 RepID=A0A410X0K7_9BACL|nr:HNH endonuclease signature motif containing protein [Paenibacillus chitinolyticus]MCY9593751.1 HNH endonuclease [Paenibacillus chitinolyticus]MCY9599684.1 HNH endonuclease [Paenibacillus chitinolyticus]QAV20140.1 HNH endonuclease [Paenibacillus chitinolyticus]